MPCLAGCSKSDSPSGSGSGPSGSAGDCRADGGSASCTCPPVEIEINNTPDAKDDLVGLKCEHPAHRSIVNCRIKAKGAGAIRTIVLTNPDGRLRFPNTADTTTTVNLPADGSWVGFQISGELGSNAIGDAVIEAHCQTATGALVGKKPATVFWFDQAEIKVTPGGNYTLVGTTFAPPGHGVDHSAKARIRPAGVDCTAPQVANLKIGIMQNTAPATRRTDTWGNPTIAWAPGVAAGTKATVPTQMRLSTRRPVTCNDSIASVAPLYDQPAKADTLDADSLKPPIGCAGGAVATSFDTPANRNVRATFMSPATDVGGTVVGVVTYTLINTTIDTDFTSWAAVFNTATNEFCVLRQRTWSLHIDSAGAGAQKATSAASDAAATSDPVTAPPYSNDVVNDPANQSTGPVGAATTDFTK